MEGEALSKQERCARIAELADLATRAQTKLQYEQYMKQIWVLSYIG
jgi:hypothetical protein